MDVIIMNFVCLLICLACVLVYSYDERVYKKDIMRFFAPGRRIQFYTSESNFLPILKKSTSCVVVACDGEWVRFRYEDGDEREHLVKVIYQYGTRCEAFDGDRLVAIMTPYNIEWAEGNGVPVKD